MDHLTPADPDVLTPLGDTLTALGRHDEATARYARATALTTLPRPAA